MKTHKTWFYAILLLMIGMVFSNKLNAQTTYTVAPDAENWVCGLDSAKMDALASDTGFIGRMGRYNYTMANPPGGSAPAWGAPFIIPVVFHVISTSSATAVLPYAQIQWQMARINAAFQNQMNLFNGQPLGTRSVNTQIEFRLACVAQNSVNAFTNANEPGVMRYASSNPNVLTQGVAPSPSTTVPMLAITHPSAYPTTFPFANYLNIWCVPSLPSGAGGAVMAYGTFPWMSAGIDGIVTRIDIVGNNSYPTNFSMANFADKGSILVHEVGHYLGLYHTFQPQTLGCTVTPNLTGPFACYGTTGPSATCEGDLVLDTPPTTIHNDLGSMLSINSCNETNFPYGGAVADQNDQLENYMSYSDDDKLNTFTAGQRDRMQGTFTTTAFGNRTNLNNPGNLVATGISTNSCAPVTNILTGIFNYSLAPGSNCNTVNVQFTNPLSVGFNTVGTTYTWNFGNGTGSGPNPLHAYSTSGGTLYLVSCTATNGTATATFTQNISVGITSSIVGQTGPNVCRGSEQTIYIAFGQNVPSIELTDGVNPPITVYNAMTTSPHTQPYTFPINASATYSIYPIGCNTTTATFNVTDCCNTLITNGDFESGISGYYTQLVTPFVTFPYPYYGSYELHNPANSSLTPGIHNATGNAMNIDGFCGQPPALTYSIVGGCNSATIPSVTPTPIVWQQQVSGLTAGLNYYYSFKISEQFNSVGFPCRLTFTTKIYNTSLTALSTQTITPIDYVGSFGNPTPYKDFVVYTYTFTAPAGTTPATTFSVELNQIKHFYGGGWDYHLDNIILQQMTPSVQAIGTATICPAQTATLNAVAACSTSTANFSYVWSPSAGLTNPNIINPVANPTTTTIYTLVATPTATGVPASITTVTITVRPTFTVTPTSQIIYAGNSAIITAGGSTGSYTWNPGAVVSNSIVVTPSVTTIYTVTNVATGTCTPNNTATVVVSTACSQTATAAFGNTVTNTNFPVANYTVSGTVYDLQGSITFTANTSFTGYTLRMAPGTVLKVDANVTLTLDNCKLFGCTELWQGIQLQMQDPKPGSSIDIKNGTIIEDMYYGIYKTATYTTTTGGQGFISIVNSKLNKNYIGVQVGYLPSYTAGDSYSLTVKNSTLTTASSTTSPGNTLKPSSIPSYTYAYNNIAGGAGGGSSAYTNFPRSYIGINLGNLSTTNPVVIGDSAGATNTFNTFSNLDLGIVATNAQLRVHNNYFYNLKGSTKQVYTDPFNPGTPPIGPDEIGVAIVASHTVANTYSLQVGTRNGPVSMLTAIIYPKSNIFKTLNKGISAKNCKVVIAKCNWFEGDTTDVPRSDLTMPVASDPTYSYLKAQSAIWITALSQGASLSYNYVRNYRTGLSTSQTMSVTSGAYITILSNNIQSQHAMGYCRQAINIEQIGGASIGPNLLEVRNNAISRVYSGIFARNINGGLYINGNPNISMDGTKTIGKGSNPGNFGLFGITLQNVSNGVVTNNLNVYSTGTITASNYSLINAFYVTTSPTNTITCNSANNVGKGYYFQANCTSPNGWLGNSITNSYRGMELKSSGVIGTQGTIPSGTLAANTWSTVVEETYVSGTTNANTASNMYVQTNGTYTTAPGLNFGAAGQTYSVGPTLGIDIRTGTPFDCGGGCGGCRTGSLPDSAAAAAYEALYAGLATASDSVFPEYADEMMYQSRQLVYRLQDQGLLTTTANSELQDFYTANQTSNIGKFTDVQTAVANNEISQAISMNGSIAPANAVEAKTQRANELMLKLNADCNYQFTASEFQDLSNMANECAVKGWYVAQSRSIVNAVTGTIMEYTDDCEEASENSKVALVKTMPNAVEQPRAFKLYPNPNNGVMTMYYDLGKDKVAELNLYDVTGKLISNYNLQNAIGTLDINEDNLHNGIYFYRILVNGKIINTNKIVIIK